MPISIDQWHVAVGLFGASRYAAIIKKTIWKYSNLKALTILLFFYSTVIFLLLVHTCYECFWGFIYYSSICFRFPIWTYVLGFLFPICFRFPMRIIHDPQKSNQNIFHVVIGMSAVYWLITKYPSWQLIIPSINMILYVYQRQLT